MSVINPNKFCKIWCKVASFNQLNDHISYDDATVFCDEQEAVYFSSTVLKNRTFLIGLIEDARKMETARMRQNMKEIILFLARQDVLQKFMEEDMVEKGVRLYNESKAFFRKNGKKKAGITKFEVQMKRYLLDLLNEVRSVRSINDNEWS